MTSDDPPIPVLDSPGEASALGLTANASVENRAVRLRQIVNRHYGAVWRTVRFLGTSDEAAEDVAQQVFCIAARKLAQIEPGAERSFLLSTAWRVASENRRWTRRRPEAADRDVDEIEAPLPSPEQLLDQKRARAALQSVLSAMPPDLRIVFVLFEIEEMTVPEIAAATGVPLGTATSRLRRAREAFQAIVRRRNAAVGSAERGGVK